MHSRPVLLSSKIKVNIIHCEPGRDLIECIIAKCQIVHGQSNTIMILVGCINYCSFLLMQVL